MKLFVAIYDDYALLPHFLKHFGDIGIDRFYVAADRSVASEVRRQVAGVDATVRDDLDVVDSFQGGAKAVTQMRLDYTTDDEWVLITDLDEFVVFEQALAAVVAGAELERANVVRGRMVDRVSADGSLPEIREDTDVWASFPRECELTSRLQGSVDYKGVLVKGHLLPTMAHHEFEGEMVSRQLARVHHFKWNARAEARTRVAMEMARAAGISWWPEYARVLDHLRAHGRIRWEDFAVASDDARSLTHHRRPEVSAGRCVETAPAADVGDRSA